MLFDEACEVLRVFVPTVRSRPSKVKKWTVNIHLFASVAE